MQICWKAMLTHPAKTKMKQNEEKASIKTHLLLADISKNGGAVHNKNMYVFLL